MNKRYRLIANLGWSGKEHKHRELTMIGKGYTVSNTSTPRSTASSTSSRKRQEQYKKMSAPWYQNTLFPLKSAPL